jgi:beta-RFAP synthase
MWVVRTASRLHFGFFSLAAPGRYWPDREGGAGIAARRFGGVGLMVRHPGVTVSATAGREWSAAGPLAERALAFAQRAVQHLHRKEPGQCLPVLRIDVNHAAPEHAGLGTGTQLGLAAGQLVALASGAQVQAPVLARWAGRGLRSALGVHGFEHGGLLVEAGKGAGERLGTLAARVDFPPHWAVVLAAPTGPRRRAAGLHGPDEREAIARLQAAPANLARTDALCRLAVLGLLPAAADCDLQAFGDALFDFNRRAGEAFAPVQGGIYASPAVADLVAFFRSQAVRGVGQSSWGPTVFAVVGDRQEADALAGRVREHGPGPAEVIVTAACNRGASAEPITAVP